MVSVLLKKNFKTVNNACNDNYLLLETHRDNQAISQNSANNKCEHRLF